MAKLDPNILHSFFQFLKDKRGRDFPIQYKLVHAPELIVPADLNIGGNLSLYNLPNLKTLPAGLNVGGYLRLYNLPNLKTLPAGLNVGGYLNLANTPLNKYSEEEIRAMIEKQGGSIKGRIYI